MADDQFLNLQPGTVVNGRYEIVKCLGAGSMGMVYVCRHRELSGHLVAMKVLFTEVARDSVAAARFRNEIVASYGVSHPNVVRAYEYFRDGDLIAFTMEYINGGDLADRINSDEPMPIAEVIRMLTQMASGVQAIHEAGIIHRDLKPENILIGSGGDIKITDFGIARTATGPKLTEHGGVVGTIDYVSPEYLERGQVDGRSDIYSLGVIAYEMITGEPPFKGKSVIETMTMRLKADPKLAHILRPECPPELSNIVMRAMDRDPETRYQNAGEMQRDLEALKAGTELPFASEVRRPSVTDSGAGERHTPPPVRSSGSGSHSTRSASPRSYGTSRGEIRDRETNDPVEQLEPVLRRGIPMGPISGPYQAAPPVPTVSVSHTHLSSDRIRKLSSDIAPDDGIWKNIVLPVVVVVLGFGAGIYVLTRMVDDSGDQPLGINEELFQKP